jgi:hypothetical protein
MNPEPLSLLAGMAIGSAVGSVVAGIVLIERPNTVRAWSTLPARTSHVAALASRQPMLLE